MWAGWTGKYIYRPQRSCGQGNIFTPVCHSVHRGGLPQCMLGYHPPRTRPPPGTRQTPPRPGRPPCWDHADTPQWTRPAPPRDQPPPPPPEADSSIRSTSGRYAFYWNAYLLVDYIVTGWKWVILPTTYLIPFYSQNDNPKFALVLNIFRRCTVFLQPSHFVDFYFRMFSD